MSEKRNAMRGWLSTASRAQAERVARLAKTTLATLRQIAGGYRTEGEARTTPEMARNIELATTKVTPASPVSRANLCPACARCEYFKKGK